jgi:hypothetical protein
MEKSEEPNQSTEIRLDRKSKILFIVIGLLIAGSVTVTFWRYMVKHDYTIESQIDCDPETENCFIWKCDPDSLEKGEQCTGVPDNDIWYYKIFRRNAKNIPLCDPNDENCDALTCPDGEKECKEILCNSENVGKDEECSNPEQYLLENPPEEEGCEEGDTECEAASESEECAPDDEECVIESEEECSPDDEECLIQAQQEEADDKPADENSDE